MDNPNRAASPLTPDWDYLIITASNDEQAAAYRQLISLRENLGLTSGAKNILVVADPGGRRVGSGGSTLYCLLNVLDREWPGAKSRHFRPDPAAFERIFGRLRILIVHAGGDSKRLPPYGPCGKIFVPVPGESDSALGVTLFDRLIPTYLELPLPASAHGQVVVASGDVLLAFDAANVRFAADGVTGIGCLAGPEVAKNHGVFCRGADGRVKSFLQKPSLGKQRSAGAINSHGQSILDIGILNLAPHAAAGLLDLCTIRKDREGCLGLRGPVAGAIHAAGLDLYREICCAMGQETTFAGYEDEVRSAGSKLGADVLKQIYQRLRKVPFSVDVVPRLRFLHFGTLRELLDSGRALLSADMGGPEKGENLVINSRLSEKGAIHGKNCWIEGCRVEAPLTVAGDSVIAGIDVEEHLSIPRSVCLDVLEGRDREGRKGWFVRVYGIDDAFHISPEGGARICGTPVLAWIVAMGAKASDVWKSEPEKKRSKSVNAPPSQGQRLNASPGAERSVWNGRFFPFVRHAQDYRHWLWMNDPRGVAVARKRAWIAADRYSLEEMSRLTAQDAFHARRQAIRGRMIREALPRAFSPDSGLSAAEISFLALGSGSGKNEPAGQAAQWVVEIVREAYRMFGTGARATRGRNRGRDGDRERGRDLESLELSRILHTLGSVVQSLTGVRGNFARQISAALDSSLTAAEKRWLGSIGLPVEPIFRAEALTKWAERMREEAFHHLGRTIVYRTGERLEAPRSVLRSDEIVWGRAPARLDLGGGWTDTPPYSLERGGCVINAAVDLNGQAPIQAYARVIEKPEIRINSIDHSTRLVIREVAHLLDYRTPGSQFALGKAALALSGFAPEAARWPRGARTIEGMLRHFGGGIELTTLAAIPSGSGLGTSSIMGAVLMSVIGRAIGRNYTHRELFHAVLRLEQELTTGGGWQDQIGGVVGGTKMISAEAGLVPDPQIHFVPADLLDPEANGGRTLLYYTGLRRLAKNILHAVVGRYLDRDRKAMATLGRLYAFPPIMADAMSTKDMERFGALIDLAWQLNVDLDPDHSTPAIEELRARIRPHIYGAKLLGAGGGGFLLMVCKSRDDAAMVKRMLETDPPNDKARFFAYSINREGLTVTVC